MTRSIEEAKRERALQREAERRHQTGQRPMLLPINGGVRSEDPVAVIRPASSYQIEPIRWVWRNWLALGKLHVLAGAPGTCKTTLAIEMAAIVSKRGTWPDGSEAPLGDVVIWSGEDSPEDTLVPRLIAAGADLDRVALIDGTHDGLGKRPFDPSTDMLPLQRALADFATPKLLIVDPVASMIVGDSHKAAEVRAGLQPLVDLSAGMKLVGLGLHHFAKNTQGKEPLDRLIGSVGFGAAPRVVMTVVRPADQAAALRLVRAKSNIGPTGGGFEYRPFQQLLVDDRISAQAIEWGQELTGMPKTLLDVEQDKGPDALAEAVDFLRDYLSDGPKTAKDIAEAADANGHSARTIKRAKAHLGVKSAKQGIAGGWVCELPPKNLANREGGQE